MTQQRQLGRTCAACGTRRLAKSLLYDINTFQPYCRNPYACNEDHPNSPKNLIERGEEAKLVSFTEAQKFYKEHLMTEHADPEYVDAVRKLVKGSFPFRIIEPELAQHIVEFNREMQHDSISETIREIIRSHMESKGLMYSEKKTLLQEKRQNEQVEKAVQEFNKQEPKKDETDDMVISL